MGEAPKTVGRYELLRVVGRGGVSTVYQARDPLLDRIVGLKELDRFGSRDSLVADHFMREARLAGSLNHPNVVTVYEYFEHRGTPYIAMEYMDRGPLRPYIGHLSLAQICGVLEAVLAGLAHAAMFRVVHGDLKPENLLVTSDGRVKIADFGVAIAVGRIMTPSGEPMAVGTPAYMAPEQAMAQQLGAQTDLYALGCVAFELFTGQVPFHESDNTMVTLLRQVNEPIPPVRYANPGIPPGVSDWVERLLIKDPALRTRSATEAWDELEKVVVEELGALWRRHARLSKAQLPRPSVPLTPAPFEQRYETYETLPPVGPEPAPEPVAPTEPDPRLVTGAAAPVPAARPADPELDRPTPPPVPKNEDERVEANAHPELQPARSEAPARHGRAPSRWRLHLPRRRRTQPAAAQTQAPQPVVTRRTPHMDLSPAAPLEPGAEFDVAVYVDQLPARRGEQTEDVLLRAPREITSFRLEVWLVATHHFLIADAPIKTITVTLAEPRSEVAVFRGSVVTTPAEGDEPLISASFSCDGRPTGRVTRIVPIVTSGARGRLRDPVMTDATLEVDVLADLPDLVMEISAPENDGRRFEVRIGTPHLRLDRQTDSWFLPAEASAMVDAAMTEFFAPDASRAARLRSLEGAGIEFFDSAPTLFKEIYWRLNDASRKPRTMLIVSDERSIPWELMVPRRRRADGAREVHPPLGTEIAIGRWHRASGISPRQRVRLRTSYVVAPEYRMSSRLAHAAEEARFVFSRFPGRCIEPASFERLDRTLKEQSVDLLHFICHGESDDSGLQVLLLEEPDTLNSRQVQAMPGLAKAFEEARPMVFLNACEIGRPTRGLIGTAGFAKSFIDLDASCVIGALWSVEDDAAHRVAIEFYKHVLTNPSIPFAEVLRDIRRRGYEEDGDDSYAAYCFYGDPAARIA